MVLAALPHGNGRVLPERCGAAPRDAEPDLHRDDALHGDPVFSNIFALPLPGDRPVGAVPGVQVMMLDFRAGISERGCHESLGSV